jgi:hypothetical protein
MAQQGKVKTNPDPYTEEYKHANLAFITDHQHIKNKDCRHNPIYDVYKGEQVSGEPEFPEKYPAYIKHNSQSKPAAEHHEQGKKLDV